MRALALLLLVLPGPVMAQVAVTSPRPERVAVTVYRDLNRGNRALERNWLNGYALISEARTIAIPAGESELRFEGVASGIIPQSAIVAGVPEGLLERNRDALLLSAGSLIDRSLGQRVSLRRTDRATGKVVTEDAIVRTGSQSGVVLQTAAGIEALRCSGLAETLAYDRVPPGLSARPTLSVRVRARQALQATVTLSYLATGFDWQADYVATLSPDERRLELRAWLTLASTDDTSFVDATTQAVAGRVNREDAEVPDAEAPPIRLQCWPQGTTSEIETEQPGFPPPPPPPPPMAAAPAMESAQDIVVTGMRVMKANREQLGDLQLYRIPEQVTVAANAQKQVGLIDQPTVRVTPVYTFLLTADAPDEVNATLVLRTQNRAAEGLGLPLPAGRVVVMREGGPRPLLIGEGSLDDKTIGEKVEVALDDVPGVRARLVRTAPERFRLDLSNDRSVPVAVEVKLLLADGKRISADGKLVRRDGDTLWIVTVPANGRAQLAYRLKD
ncbi:DUF4139 domain-containing protein [Sphingomonas astaxanthinifaciens]|uniref:DUF4139 domain-containing protein n=1 Tax=Sphingomonas astaxanthinifaciens DSM 22298 TaxID=1123267 RepID=A0ABQ5Z6A7_9SPHN|nr:hypothetical protein [Sphingomonas astaxanthinifaciens]GLR47565.1 hypothetical protein GCM10007925_12770 [Sphingomonas astaxanthinifaciens DSM 22298]